MNNREFQIITENGSQKRVNVEHGVTNVETLLRWQRELEPNLPGIRLKPETDFHVTLFAFGRPEDLFKRMLAAGANVNFEAFLKYLMDLLYDTEHVVPHTVTMTSERLDKFGGDKEPVVVVRLADNAELADAHHHVRLRFEDFVRACGIEQVRPFIEEGYYKFQADTNFLPHISLGRLPYDMELPVINVHGAEFVLTRSRLRNVNVLAGGNWVWSH